MAFVLMYGLLAGVILFIAIVLGLFFGNIILFDSLLLAIIAGYLAHSQLAWHPVFCILIGLGVLILLFSFQNTRIGFWTIGMLFSLAWSLLISVFVYDGTGNDMIWCYFSLAVSFIIMFGLHKKAWRRVNYD